jgi:hypothetical protein
VAQQILYGNKIGICIEQLGCHSVPHVMTGCLYPGSLRVIFNSLLNAAH